MTDRVSGDFRHLRLILLGVGTTEALVLVCHPLGLADLGQQHSLRSGDNTQHRKSALNFEYVQRFLAELAWTSFSTGMSGFHLR